MTYPHTTVYVRRMSLIIISAHYFGHTLNLWSVAFDSTPSPRSWHVTPQSFVNTRAHDIDYIRTRGILYTLRQHIADNQTQMMADFM